MLKNTELTCCICVWYLLYGMIWASIICLLLQTVLADMIIKDPELATALSSLSSNVFCQVFPYSTVDQGLWNAPTISNLEYPIHLVLFSIWTLIIHVTLLWAASPMFTLTHQMAKHNWYRAEHFYKCRVAPPTIIFTHCYPMTSGISAYFLGTIRIERVKVDSDFTKSKTIATALI